MTLMRHPAGGWHNADAKEAETMAKAGWIVSSEAERLAALDAKRAAAAPAVVEVAKEEPQEEAEEVEAEYTLEYLREQWADKYGKPADLRKGHRTLRTELGSWLQPKTE